MRFKIGQLIWRCALSVSVVLTAGSCKRASDAAADEKLVVYCSVDETFGRDVLDQFEARTGAELDVIFDSEAGKTTGLVNKIIAEASAGRPRADVFWSSEVFNTILLAREGFLEPYDSPAASDIPPRFRDSRRRWTALAARARVLTFDPMRTKAPGSPAERAVRNITSRYHLDEKEAKLLAEQLLNRDMPDLLQEGESEVPLQWEALGEPRFAKHVAFANPLFGTTRGHVAAMFALWGPERGRAFLTRLRDGGALIADSNGATVRAVIASRAALAATDTDDVWVAQRGGASLDLTYPDMGDGGTLLIPCSVAIVKGSQNIDAARRLVDFLVSAEVERMLAKSDSRNVPVRDALRRELNMQWPPESKVSFDAVADAMDEAVAAVREILIR